MRVFLFTLLDLRLKDVRVYSPITQYWRGGGRFVSGFSRCETKLQVNTNKVERQTGSKDDTADLIPECDAQMSASNSTSAHLNKTSLVFKGLSSHTFYQLQQLLQESALLKANSFYTSA